MTCKRYEILKLESELAKYRELLKCVQSEDDADSLYYLEQIIIAETNLEYMQTYPDDDCEIVEDLIDCTPDNSMYIYYCIHCLQNK